MKITRIAILIIVGILLVSGFACGGETTPTYQLFTSVDGQGSVSPSGGSFSEGDAVTLTATPASCWQFDHWSGDANGSQQSITFTIASDKTITAHFTKIQYTLSTSLSSSGSGSISPSGGNFDCGTQVTLTATAASGWRFDNWEGDVSGSLNPINITMNSDKVVVADFTPTEEPPLPELQAHFIDVGQGDCILIDLGESEVLIDGGDRSPGVTAYLEDYVNGSLEVLIATHPHADHIGGLIEVLDDFDVEEIWLNGHTHTSNTYSDFMDKVTAEGAEVKEARRGDTIAVDSLVFHVLHPVEPLVSDINNNSIVLMLSYGEIEFLFTGDAETEAEASMIADGVLADIEILKVGHHGSRSSSSQAFLDIIEPEHAIYMAGEGNQYGHPHAETISALENIGAEVYGTDVCGTIIVETDGNEYTISECAPTPTPTPTPITGDYCSPDCLCYSYTLDSYILCAEAGAICNDGTCSLSTGSGTCSWHGGVKVWINCP